MRKAPIFILPLQERGSESPVFSDYEPSDSMKSDYLVSSLFISPIPTRVIIYIDLANVKYQFNVFKHNKRITQEIYPACTFFFLTQAQRNGSSRDTSDSSMNWKNL